MDLEPHSINWVTSAKGGAQDYIVNGKMTRGFAILAYPAEYQHSGIMTFLVGTDGIQPRRWLETRESPDVC